MVEGLARPKLRGGCKHRVKYATGAQCSLFAFIATGDEKSETVNILTLLVRSEQAIHPASL